MMKKLLVIAAISTFAACGGATPDPSAASSTTGTGASPISNMSTGDSLKRALDSVKQTGDTSALNSKMGDSSSASSSHGQGSGSRVGGGKTGGPQRKKGK